MAAVLKITQADRSAKECRRWKKELTAAGKREKEWRTDAEKTVKRYRGEEKKKNRFNVLWSNMEILRPSIYNSRPAPDVRRRFRDSDPTGKAVSEILERSLMVMVDQDATDQGLKNDTLDGLLCGRGVSRIRYIPVIKQEPPPEVKEDEEGTTELNEKVDSETVCIDHVDWRDYREGYGRTWAEVPWNAFRHKLTRADSEKKFGKEALGSDVEYTAPANDDDRNTREDHGETKVAEFWEIWDKEERKVCFIQENVKEILYPRDNPSGLPPIEFADFFCTPDPLRIIEDTGSRTPVIPFSLYESQANELDKISGRIDRIVEAMRLRGIRDSKLVEIENLMTADDNELVPVENAQAWSDKGLDAAISWFPTEKAAALLDSLYEARDRQKAIIDELTGIADIMRGATDPNETKGAQDLKATFGSVRLQRMQKEVQRYAKDLMRLASEAMCEKFSPQTFTEMTELQFPTAEQQQALHAQMALAQQQGQPGPDPQLLQVPTWEAITAVMRSNSMRRYKVDVETDSTVAGTLNSDMQGLSQVLTAIHEVLTGLAPVVTSGALPPDAAKELVMTVIRRARMGIAVEDAFDKLKAPNPPPPPPQPQVEAAKIKAASDEKLAGIDAQAKVQVGRAEQAAQAQSRQAELAMEAQKDERAAQIEIQKDAQLKAHELQLKESENASAERKLAMELENARLIADANNQTKVLIAQIGAHAAAQKSATDLAKTQLQGEQKGEQQATQIDADQQAAATEAPAAASYEPQESAVLQGIQKLIEQMSKPRRVMRDPVTDKIVGVQ